MNKESRTPGSLQRLVRPLWRAAVSAPSLARCPIRELKGPPQSVWRAVPDALKHVAHPLKVSATHLRQAAACWRYAAKRAWLLLRSPLAARRPCRRAWWRSALQQESSFSCKWCEWCRWRDARPNDPSSATRPTRALDCNLDAMAGFAAAHG